jgi:N utilization substance protein B
MKQSRRESREAAFLLLFEWSFHENTAEDTLRDAKAARDLDADAFARSLFETTLTHVTELDSVIESSSDHWKLGRISRVNLAALRIAFCELRHFDDIPQGATINEAVELVKKYGTEDEAAYLNGILGGYVRSLR